MTHATRSDTTDTSRVANLSLSAATLGITLVAVVAFVLSFHGLDDYGRRVAGLGQLSPLVPIAIDGLTLLAVATTTLLRHSPWHVRAYAWFVFAVASGLSIGGNLAHAAARHLPPAGEVGAVASPVVLALGSHLAIVTMRQLERQKEQRQAAEAMRRAETESAVKAERRAARVATPPPSGDATPPRQRAATPRPPKTPRASDVLSGRVRQMWSDGQSHAEIAMALGISKKTAERHTEPLRQKAPPDVAEEPDRAEATA